MIETIPLELRVWRSYDYCEECGDVLVLQEPDPRRGQSFGPFMACFSFPGCSYTRAIQTDGTIVPLLDPLEDLSWI